MTPTRTDHLADADRRATALASIRCGSTDPMLMVFRHLADIVHATRVLTAGTGEADLHAAATRLGDLLASAHVDDEGRLGNPRDNALGIGEIEDFDTLIAVSDAIEAATTDAPDLLRTVVRLVGTVAVLASGDYDDGQELADHITDVCRELAGTALKP